MTSLVPSPNQVDIFTALRAFLLAILPTGTPVIRGQVNRVPEPAAPDFAIMWPLRMPRLTTNIDTYADCVFTASIVGTVMTVSSIQSGALAPPAQLFGTGVVGAVTGTGVVGGPGAGPTMMTVQLTGSPGNVGTYQVAPAQFMALSPAASGAELVVQPAQCVIQIDVHGPNSMDNAQTISTLFRDEFAVAQFAELNSAITPLYADDPKQIPFINAEDQYEDRWVVEAYLQVNQTVSIPQQFAAVSTVQTVTVP